jgi:hypothetical protein
MNRRGQITTMVLMTLVTLIFWSYLAIAATYDATGTWDYSTYSNVSTCPTGPEPPTTGYITIIQTGDSVRMSRDGDKEYTGSVNGSHYTCTGSYLRRGGMVSETLYVTLTSNTAASGTSTWTWTDGYDPCSGGSQFSGTKQVATTGPNQPFADVSSANDYVDYIKAIYEAGITKGYGNGTYGPGNPVTRDQMAAFIIRALFPDETFDYSTTAYFTDVPSSGPTQWAFRYIQKLKELGITTMDDQYCPSELVTRDQMAAFIIRALFPDETFDCSTTPYFTDVPSSGPDQWAFRYIQKLKELGITTGYGDGSTYGPKDPVTREQMAAFLGRAFLGMK